MSLYDISCPNCQLAFKINEQQLALKDGFVRCTHCRTIFSAAKQLQANHLPTMTQEAPHTFSPSKPMADRSDDILFDDESGLDEAGNPIMTKEAAPASPYAISKPYVTSTPKKSSAISEDFDILDNFMPLSKPDATTSSQLAVDTIDSLQAKNTTIDENAWLERLMAEASEDEEAQANRSNNHQSKGYTHSAVNIDILEQIAIDTSDNKPSDLLTYQNKIDQRLSQQVSSQKAITSTFSKTNLLWGLASLLLLLGLAAQYIIFNIHTLVISKQTAAKLTSVCQSLSLTCHLPIADVGLINVETLKLASAAKQAGKTDVIFTLTNTTSNHVVYPNLKVSLRAGNTIQAQTIVTPVNYLQAGSNYLMPNQIKAIKLRIDYPKSAIHQVNIEPFY